MAGEMLASSSASRTRAWPLGVDEPGCPKPDRVHVVGRPQVSHDVRDDFLGLHRVVRGGRAQGSGNYPAALVDHTGRDLGATDVDPIVSVIAYLFS